MPISKKLEPSNRFWREVSAVSLLFSTAFLLLCLLSYSLPLYSESPALQQSSENWCGSFGFYTAHYLFSFFGLTAFLPVILLLYSATMTLFSSTLISRLPYLVAGITGLLLSSSALFFIIGQLFFPVSLIPAGGYLGGLIHGTLYPLLGTAGTILALVLLLTFSLMAAVQFSPVRTTGFFMGGCLRLLKRIFPLPGLLFKGQGDESPLKSGKRVDKQKGEPAINNNVVSVHRTEPKVHEPVRIEEQGSAGDMEFALRPPTGTEYQLPPLSLLDHQDQEIEEVDRKHYMEVSNILSAKLLDFGVHGTVEGISPGPVVTTYEFAPAPGVKINKIVGLADDLAMALRVDRVRVVGSIPGKAALGIEIPNPIRKTVYLQDILLGKQYCRSSARLLIGLGFDVIGQPVVADLSSMPHLLIAGATGAGKSVGINAFIASILFKATPEEVRLLLIDPKRIELSVYEGIPHLLHPVVVEPKMASRALLWAVREMERRYKLLEDAKVKSFASYNKISKEPLPYIVIIVDELADLMMVASKDVEHSIARLAQMARAAGMHIILATQRPSVDVLTGLIKANFPTRISFKVSSKVDSRTILDGSGAEHLLGMGDMLFLPPGAAKLQRIHGAYISEHETERIVDFLKEQGSADYDQSAVEVVEKGKDENNDEKIDYDDKYDEAVAIVTESGQASISMVQRRLRVGYNRAARMIEVMEKEGLVGPADGGRPREVLARREYSAE
jgi:S-DNA-T family DNA segregation ATPase FtsK/SpoIIIE